MTDRSFHQVLTGIQADLASGQLEVGQKLPAERALAEQYQVSRGTVREAVRVLEAMGMIRTATGSGKDAGNTVTGDLSVPLGTALRWHLAGRQVPVADIVEARMLLEAWAVASACRTVDDGGAALGDILDRMDAENDHAAFLALDAQFHVGMAETAGNVVVAAIMAAMRTGIHEHVLDAVAGRDDWPAMADTLRRENRAILQAVVDGDADSAIQRVHEHIAGFYAATGVGITDTAD